MNIAIIGTGYVGLVSGACFAEMGNNVTCIDINTDKIKALQQGNIPIYEPQLSELICKNINLNRIHFSTDLSAILNSVDIVFITVGTQLNNKGEQDLSSVFNVAKNIGNFLDKYVLVVIKSTVQVGTSKIIKSIIQSELDKRKANIAFDVASNPEFLREGNAIKDFMHPDRIVIGADSSKAKMLLENLYEIIRPNTRIIFTDTSSAEMAKFASNAMLATRISLINEIANLCEKVGANITMVQDVLKTDTRIGSKYLEAGCGYGGSCLPKDVKSLIKISEENNLKMQILESVEASNNKQKNILFNKFKNHFGDIKNKHIAILGLSFKPETDDMREAPSLTLINKLIESECTISAYDPVAMPECQRKIGDIIKYSKNVYECVKDADAIFLVTEWSNFSNLDWDEIKKLAKNNVVLFDGRNFLEPTKLCGIKHIRIG